MPIQTVCPECDSVYLLADQQAGKKVRCKKCQAVIEVPAPPAKRTAVRGDAGKPAAAVTPRRAAPTRRPRDDDEDDWDEPRDASARKSVAKKSGSALPWIIGGVAAGAGLLLLMCGGIITYFVMASDKSASVASNPASPPQPVIIQPLQPQAQPNRPFPQPLADNPPVQGQPVVQPNNPPPAKANNPPPAARDDAPPKAASNGKLTAEGRDRVKRATVYIRVKTPDGGMGSGTGFFGCKGSPNIVLTNAHVVGMLAPESMRPLAVEVVVNSGEANEWKTSARVLGVDRASDLAVLDIGTPTQPVPEPLTIKSAGALHELDDVWVFGFPYGERLGKEITIRSASVASLRRKNGALDRVQVHGGMDPGNSGGPVVDGSGAVVGVAVAVWAMSRQISFAIPGERVLTILEGRISELTIHQPYYTPDNKIAVPVVADMIDPRNLVKQVSLEVWTGDKPADDKATRPASRTQPPAQSGDSARVAFMLKYLAPEGKLNIVLPDLPSGKVYWQQAKWINAKGEARWASASQMRLPGPPVYRKPANLALHYNSGTSRSVDLNIENIFKISGNDDDANAFRIRTAAQFTETVASSNQSGTVLRLRYRHPPHRETILPDGQTRADKKDEQFVDQLPRLLTTSLQLDRLGNILKQAVELNPRARINQQQLKPIKEFHERIQQGLESLAVSLPPSGTANPLDSWRAERSLPIDTPGKTELGKIDVTFTYLGTRKRDGREEGVINMDGLVRGNGDGIGGKATGQILVDLASGQTLMADTTVKLQLDALLSEDGKLRPIRVLATMKFRMQRKL